MDKYIKVDTVLKQLNELDYYYQYGSEGKVSPRALISKISNIILDCPLEAVIPATSRNTATKMINDKKVGDVFEEIKTRIKLLEDERVDNT